MNKQILMAVVITSILFSACQKRDIEGVDKSKLNINITKPSEAQVFKTNDTVFISGSFNYVSQLHGYSIQLQNKTSDAVYLNIEEHLHGSSFNIDTFWVNNIKQNADLVLKLTVAIDHDGNKESKEINIKSQL